MFSELSSPRSMLGNSKSAFVCASSELEVLVVCPITASFDEHSWTTTRQNVRREFSARVAAASYCGSPTHQLGCDFFILRYHSHFDELGTCLSAKGQRRKLNTGSCRDKAMPHLSTWL